MRFTRFGWFYVIFTIAIGAAAINTGNNLLYLTLGILLSFIIISGILSDSALWGLRIELQAPRDLFAKRSSSWDARVQKGWFPGALVEIRLDWRTLASQSFWVPWLSSKARISLPLEVTPPRRGWLELTQVRFSSAFPFGLFEKSHRRPERRRWLVFPSIETVDLDSLLGPARDAARHHQPTVGSGTIPWRLRDYQPGDPARWVDWKTSARRQRLLVKEFEQDHAPGQWLVVREWPKGSEAEREELLSFIASIVWSARRSDRSIGLTTPDAYFPPAQGLAHYRRLWRYLALVHPVPGGPNERKITDRSAADVQSLWARHRRREH